MDSSVSITQSQLLDFLLTVAPARPVFVWGQPGIGKSALVEQFAADLDMQCVSLLGSQLAPEDLIGVPQIQDGVTRFYPPAQIARDVPYVLFLDELNACSHEVQKAFYSLIHERRIGEYHLPEGSVIIAAGNRTQDSAIVKPMSSALMNRMLHVSLRVSHRDWLEWAQSNNIHPLVLDYLQVRSNHLWSKPPKTEQPFSTPRSWHMLSDALHEYGDDLTPEILRCLAFGALTAEHATQFCGYHKTQSRRYAINDILKGKAKWPRDASDRDVLHFLCLAFRDRLLKELPAEEKKLGTEAKQFKHAALEQLAVLAQIDAEMAQLVLTPEGEKELPGWFLVEVVKTIPRIKVGD